MYDKDFIQSPQEGLFKYDFIQKGFPRSRGGAHNTKVDDVKKGYQYTKSLAAAL